MKPNPEQEFAEVYRRHFPFVWRSALRLGVSEAEADDVCQDVFLVVHRRIVDFEERASIRTWLYSILKRVISSHRRSYARKEAKYHASDLKQLESFEAPGDHPETIASLLEHLALARDLLAQIDEEKRSVLLLVEFGGMSVVDAAVQLGLNPNTASSRLRAGRKQLYVVRARQKARGDGARHA